MTFSPTSLSATQIAARVRARELTAESVVRAHLDQIRARDGKLNAFQVVRSDAAIAEAREFDRRSDLSSLPLAGVPVAIKDNVDVAGEPTRHGSAATPATPAARDDELVARLRKAGAVVIGKTRLPELAIWPFTESAAFGDTRNPWNVERGTGGSSGGAGAAVAGLMVPIALGSDGGGSIRIPCAACGIAGLKPGPGVVPLPGGQTEHWLGMSEFGPMARTAADVALMFDVLRGTSPQARAPAAAGLRIAVSLKPMNFGAPVNQDVKAAVARIGELLGSAGHRITRADPPYGIDIGLRFGRRWLCGIAQDGEHLDLERVEPRTRKMVKTGRWIQRRGWQRAAAEDPIGARMQQWFSGYDVLVTPTLNGPAPPVGKYRNKGWIVTLLSVANWVNTAAWNLARWPAASVPGGLTSDGLPIGIQLVAPPGGEERLLALMAQIENLQPWPLVDH